MEEELILVDVNDNATGIAEKLYAHEKGLRHRAFSVFVLRQRDDDTEVLLQQRDLFKYHSGGQWSNTCCGHPRPNEITQRAAERRLYEEMAMTVPLIPLGTYAYEALVTERLWEKEITHIFMGWCENNSFKMNPQEVMDFKWLPLLEVETWLATAPEDFTPWFQGVWDHFMKKKTFK